MIWALRRRRRSGGSTSPQLSPPHEGGALSAHREAAGDRDDLARDPGGRVGSEQRHQGRDVARQAEPAGWIHFDDLLSVGGHPGGIGMAGLDQSQCQDVGRNAVAAMFFGQRFGEGDHAAARGRGDRQNRSLRRGRCHRPD